MGTANAETTPTFQNRTPSPMAVSRRTHYAATMTDDDYIDRAIELALEAEREGNLPVGAVLVLDDEIVGEGKSELLVPEYDPGAHAEIGAIRSTQTELWPRASEMSCYTTLEPCVMCFGTLLLHGVGRVVFGATDVRGGARSLFGSLPPYYDGEDAFEWIGPVRPEACDELYERADAIFSDLPVGRGASSLPSPKSGATPAREMTSTDE